MFILLSVVFFLHKPDDGQQQQQRQEPKIHSTDCKNSMLLKTDLYGFFTSIYHLSPYVNMVYNMMQSRKKDKCNNFELQWQKWTHYCYARFTSLSFSLIRLCLNEQNIIMKQNLEVKKCALYILFYTLVLFIQVNKRNTCKTSTSAFDKQVCW